MKDEKIIWPTSAGGKEEYPRLPSQLDGSRHGGEFIYCRGWVSHLNQLRRCKIYIRLLFAVRIEFVPYRKNAWATDYTDGRITRMKYSIYLILAWLVVRYFSNTES